MVKYPSYPYFCFMKKVLIALLFPLHLFAQPFTKEEAGRWEKQAQQISIIRDKWGIPHIYGKTDADAVFGLLYAQCEDDFKRVEMNYIEKLGRMSEVKGESSLYADLLIRMIIDSADAISDYKKSAPWLKKLLDAFADGINYYLYKNPATSPALLTRFKPWYPLLWTDGSIGAISTGGISEEELAAFYLSMKQPVEDMKNDAAIVPEEDPAGSNGFAFSPKITASGNAILYINPHVTFYFRPEVHMVSEEGLNVYGAVTWGQFFIYQGFNEHCGWMHTSSAVDVADMYAEKIMQKNKGWVYEYDGIMKPVMEKKIQLDYRNGNTKREKIITAYYTHHGPVMAKRDGRWISLRSQNRSINGLIQSWQRTKAKSFKEYKKVMGRLSNTSNNTVYADAEGNIAYWHGNFIPVRDTKYDWSNPVDGSISATEWRGLHTVESSVHLYNPPNGWLQNCNSTPFTVAGINSPKKENFPVYMAPDDENFRGINAVRVLGKNKSYTIDKVIEAGYDTYLAAFEKLIPALVKANEKNAFPNNPAYNQLKDAVDILKTWDLHCNENSIATTLAVEWGERIQESIRKIKLMAPSTGNVEQTNQFAATATANELLQPLFEAITTLEKDFGKWRLPWGEANRFQRISTAIDNSFDDARPSIPVGYASSRWGTLPSYSSRIFPGTKKRYGVNGNSFICAVEFGKRIKAKSLLAGGESGDPSSIHFTDQMEMYSRGEFKEVLFYKEDVLKHVERNYHPGE